MLGVLALLCPPAAVLVAGRRSQAAANAGLTLLFYFPGLFHAVGVVRRYYDDRRNETLMRLAEQYCH